jgi:predicted HicB family RNase H-like nuclease
MNDMIYKGYATKIEYSAEDGCLVGHILGIQDIVGFHGESVPEIRKNFEEAVDDYLVCCAEIGKEPQKPFSGKIMLRVSPEIHAKLAVKARVSGKSINKLVVEALNSSVNLGA